MMKFNTFGNRTTTHIPYKAIKISNEVERKIDEQRPLLEEQKIITDNINNQIRTIWRKELQVWNWRIRCIKLTTIINTICVILGVIIQLIQYIRLKK